MKDQSLTKSGKPVSQRTFGTLVCRDKECRRAAVDLELFDDDLRLLGRYFHYCGYRSIEQVRKQLKKIVKNQGNPFTDIEPIFGKVISLEKWKSTK